MLQIISPEGSGLLGPSVDLRDEQLLQMYREMVLSRILDEWLMKLQRMGKVYLHAPSAGHEAAQVGSTHALAPDDWIFPYYRQLAVYIARGVPVIELLDRFMATRDDVLKGRDFVIFGDKRYRIVPGSIPVALHIPPAVGFAFAAKLRGEGVAGMVYFGDGATSKGDFHEAMNFAGLFKVPIVFFCENNQYALSLPVSRQTAARTLAVKATAYGFEGIRVDGNDVMACYVSAKEAVLKARRGGGPTLIEAVTYRLGPHTTADDTKRYRDDAEVEEWRKKDPITRFKQFLLWKGLWSEEKDGALRAELQEFVKGEVEKVEDKPPPKPLSILEDVYSSDLWHIKEEMDELEDFVSRRGDEG